MCIEHLKKASHKDIMQAVKEVDSNFITLLQTLDAFNGHTEKPINRYDLLSYPFFKWIPLNEYVKIRRRNNYFKTYLNFDTKVKKGGAFGKHFHNDIIENAEIIEGEMIDKVNGKIYKSGEIMHYEKGEKHEPEALEDTILKVIFKQ